MIDEKRLEEIEQGYSEWLTTIGVGSSFVGGRDTREILRLARLGLWAEKHGIPALEKIRSEDFQPAPCPDPKPGIGCGVYHQKTGPLGTAAGAALAALPKEKA